MVYSQAFINAHSELIHEDIEKRIEIVTPPHCYLSQLQACLAHDTSNELGEINVPTLVIHGDSDVLVPYRNEETFAKNIQGTELFTVPGAGHIFFTEATNSVNNKVIQFLSNK
ncbi:alpha/beta fold hydrolase [Neobacillus rhizosphaerae]|uniref:alpha/beta fold hydrolase n=1 Tax=Neobacillus rhizosphaerae TaxID=2880965 RepID=UPI0029E81E6D|nr:alpha/beta hydrolase [Neobacillus rhizosphaerae]